MKKKIKIANTIINTLEDKIGKFSYKLIYFNKEQKNYVYLLKTKKGKLILKTMNKFDKKNFNNEMSGRRKLGIILKKAKIKKFVIPKLITYDKKQKWILTKYENFRTLHDICKKDKNTFKKIIIEIYSVFFPKLFAKYNLNKKIPSEYSLQDLGYNKERIYFYDFEANKELIEQYIDLYLKIGKQYIRSSVKGDKNNIKRMMELILFIKNRSKYFNKQKINNIISIRLKKGAFKEFDSPKFDKYKEELFF